MFVLDVVAELSRRKIKFALVGGYALALHGIVRATMDVDIVIGLTPKALLEAEAALTALGLTSRIPVKASEVAEFRREYIENRNLIAWSFVDFKNPTRQVDLLIVLGVDDIDVEKVSFGGKSIPVASLEDLLKMKLVSNRPEDQSDIAKIRAKLGSKKIMRVSDELSIPPRQALQFLEDVRVLYSTKDEATRAISLRVPENLLRLLKTRAEIEGKKYQSLMIEILREGLRAKN